MSIIIRKVECKSDLLTFVTYANNLYKGHPFYVPALVSDELPVFDPKTNAAYEFCECGCYLAYKDGKVAGRVAAIINHKANSIWNKKEVRFGWIDFIDDPEVLEALIHTVMNFGRQRGMTEIAGPLGFTDFDPEGMLVEGFDRMGTLVGIYNHPYYKYHLERLGFGKLADWVEYRIEVPDRLPERLVKIADMLLERHNLRIRKVTRKIIRKERYGHKLFDLINETYCVLFGYSKLSPKQIDRYVKTYLQFIDLRMVSFIENEKGELVAAGVTMPSIVNALRKSGGRMLPFGWFYLLKDLIFKTDTFEMLLIAVKPEYQNKGVASLLFADLFPNLIKLGFRWAESNPELELNTKVQGQWSGFNAEQHKRRRAYGRTL